MKLYAALVLLFAYVNFANGEDPSEVINYQEISKEAESHHIHPYGRPVSILKFDADGRFIVDNVTMDEMFLHPDVKDRKIVAVSIIGAFRRGKSFLMDYALRYMYGNYKSVKYPNNPLNNTEDWMGEPDEPLKGFSWRGGTGRDTTGVIMWSDIFLHETEKGKQLAIILLDTQGLFDTKTTPTDNSRIFALGTLASSIQIFNLNDVIQENQLEYLQLATEFSKFALKKNKENKKRAKPYKPFQNLIFLMRDWQNKQSYPFGAVGGANYLASVLQIRKDQPEPLKDVRKFLTNSFEKLDCFLMPHPGATVTTDPDYEGQRSGLDEDFEQELGDFLTYILEPNNLVAKKILNREITAAEYVEYLKAYFIAFESDEIPKAETLHTITITKHFDILVSDCFKSFSEELEIPNYNSSTFTQELDENGNTAIEAAMKCFKGKRKLGGPEHEQKYTEVLKDMIEIRLTEWKSEKIRTFNELKRIAEESKIRFEEERRQALERLENQKRLVEEEKQKLEQQQKERENELNKALEEIRNKSRLEIANLTAKYEMEKENADEENKNLFSQLNEQINEMRTRMAENEQRLKDEMVDMRNRMTKKQRDIEQLVNENQKIKNETLILENEQKRIEIENKLKLEEIQLRADIERRNLERFVFLENIRILEDAEREMLEEIRKLRNVTAKLT